MKSKLEKQYAKSMAIVFFAFLLVMGIIFSAVYNNVRKNTTEIGKRIKAEAVQVADSFLKEKVDIVALASESIDYLNEQQADNTRIEEYLVSTTQGYIEGIDSNFTGLYGVFNGEYLDGTGWDPGDDYIPEDRPWYLAAKENPGEPVIASPYVDEMTGAVMISITRLLSNGEDAVSLDISLQEMMDLSDRIYNEGYGRCVVLDNNGVVVASSIREELGQNMLNGELGNLKQAIAERSFEKEESLFETSVYNKHDIVFASKIYSDWCVILIMDRDILFRDMMTVFWICLVASLLLLAFIMYINHSSNRKRVEAEKLTGQLASAASIYISMHSLDLVSDTVETLNSAAHIDKIVGGQSKGVADILTRTMKMLTDEQYMEPMMQFIDFETLDERMVGTNTITLEFLGNASGWCRARFIAVDYNEDHILTKVLWVVENIDAEKKKSNKLLYMSETDLMTGIRNRGSGERRIKELIADNHQGMFCLLDADKFKSINDDFGHDVGDKVIIEIANCLKSSFRDTDVVMRLGGDEYAIFADGIIDNKKAEVLIKRLFDKIENINIPELGDRKITVSLGAAFRLRDGEVDFEKIYRLADSGTYESKKKPGNVYTFVD